MKDRQPPEGFRKLSKLMQLREETPELPEFDPSWLNSTPVIKVNRSENNMEDAVVLNEINVKKSEQKAGFKKKYLGMAAAAVLLLAPLFVYLLHYNTPPVDTGMVQASAIVLFKVGSVTADGKELQIGDSLKGGMLLKVGPKSLCDLQIKESASSVLIRIKEKTDYRLLGTKQDGQRSYNSRVTTGKAIFKISRLNSKENINIHTPTSIASVRGTKFGLVAMPDKTTYSLREGVLAVRIRISETEDLPYEIVNGANVLIAVKKTLTEFEYILKPGDSITVSRSIAKRILKKDPRFRKVLAHPALKKLRGKSSASPDEIQTAINMLNRAYKDKKSIEKLVRVIRGILKKEQLKNENKMSSAVVTGKLSEHDELIAMNRSGLRNNSSIKKNVRRMNRKRRKQLMSNIEKLMNKSE